MTMLKAPGECLRTVCAIGLSRSRLKLFNNLILAFLAGAVFPAHFLGYLSGIFFDVNAGGGRPLAEYAVKLANTKCAEPFEMAFPRGVGCNWLVCLAIYMSLGAGDGISKAVLIWPPITAFVALGFEHSVANMTFIPLGIFLGNSDIYLNNTVEMTRLTADRHGFFISHLIPVTLGNIVGGLVFVSLGYCKAWGFQPEANTGTN